MKTIYKYQVPLEGAFVLQLPKEAVILSFQCQDAVSTIWVMVDNTHNDEERQFRLYGTGQAIKDIPKDADLHYIGTAQEGHGFFGVWHLFEEMKKNE